MYTLKSLCLLFSVYYYRQKTCHDRALLYWYLSSGEYRIFSALFHSGWMGDRLTYCYLQSKQVRFAGSRSSVFPSSNTYVTFA
jgi:hypothetical protein